MGGEERDREEVLEPIKAGSGHEVPSFFKLMRDMLSQIGLNADITKVRIPASFCYPFSLLEFLPMKGLRGMELFSHYSTLQTREQKVLLVVKWLLGTITHDEYGKKPWNPVEGESFMLRSGQTYYFSEQVSHHPPISAYHFENKPANFKLFGHMQLQAKYQGNSVAAEAMGPLYVEVCGDRYEMSAMAPILHTRNLLVGTSRNEYGGAVTISCPDGYKVELDFRLQPKLGRMNLNVVTGKVMADGEKKPLFTLDGHWDKRVEIVYPKGMDPIEAPFIRDGNVLHTPEDVESPFMHEIRHERQKNFSSREIWGPSNKALRDGNFDLATEEKTVVEDRQRAEREAMAEEGEELELKFFDKVASGDQFSFVLRDDVWDIISDIGQDPMNPTGSKNDDTDTPHDDKKKKKKKKHHHHHKHDDHKEKHDDHNDE